MTTSDKATQLDTVKGALLRRDPVNSIVMFDAGITRLSSVIKRLRDKGYPVKTVQSNHNGLADYSLPEGWKPGQEIT